MVIKGHDHFYAKQDLDGIVYQLCPKPEDSTYDLPQLFKYSGKYKYGVFLSNSGHLHIIVDPDYVQVDYVRAYLPGDGNNGEIAYTYTIEDIRPEVLNQDPPPDATGVSIITDISFDLEDEHTGINLNTVWVEIDSELAIQGGIFQTGFSGSITARRGGYHVVINPDENFNPFQIVPVLIQASDNANQPNWVYANYSFQTGGSRIRPR
jgi:hypothetical protein